jgi:hypothetical protein
MKHFSIRVFPGKPTCEDLRILEFLHLATQNKNLLIKFDAQVITCATLIFSNVNR